MNFGLSASNIAKIRGVFSRFPTVEKAVLYGSRARGNFKKGSDIDLTLFGENLTTQELGAIADELDDLLLPYTIDLSIYEHIDNAGLREHIDRVGQVFYEKD
ncbi:MAG: nucleotidyltransferase domain-containing protein [Deltaproteobacteria bacterium]|nr:nucleotidyltransferase domain-containing protein [Deltaproteobacteria bacterium]